MDAQQNLLIEAVKRQIVRLEKALNGAPKDGKHALKQSIKAQKDKLKSLKSN